MSTTTLGIDLGKRWFHVVGRDAAGRVSHRQKFNRAQLIEFVARHPPCVIGMETVLWQSVPRSEVPALRP